MIHLVWPWVFVLIPLPFLVRQILPGAQNKATAALKVPFFKQLVNFKGYTPANAKWPVYLAGIIWLLLLLAFSRPQWLSDPVDIAQTGRDIMLAIDLSEDTINAVFDKFGKSTAQIAVDVDASRITIQSKDKTEKIEFKISEFDRTLIRTGGWVEYADKNY